MTDLEEKLTKEVTDLTAKNAELLAQISDLVTQNLGLDKKLEKLLKQVETLTSLINMKKSEKSSRRRSGDGSTRNSKLEKSQEEKPRKSKKKSSNSMQIPEGLPVEYIHIDLPLSEKVDPMTGKAFSLITENRYEYLAFEKVYKKIVIIQPVYGAGPKLGVCKMDLPEKLLANSKVDASLLAQVMIDRFLAHTPFYRQVEIFGREGFSITRQALNSWYHKLATALKPLYQELKKWMLEQEALHADETFLKRQVDDAKQLKNGYMFFLCAQAEKIAHATVKPQASKGSVRPDRQMLYMEYNEHRKHNHVSELLQDYSGKIHSDCFEGYEKLADNNQFIWQICLAHARRNFIKAPDTPIATEIEELLGKIIHEDNQLWAFEASKRLRLRKQKIKPQVDQLLSNLTEYRQDLKVESCEKLSRAFDYILNREKYVTAFLSDADLMADNNLAERAIRPVKIGQKNWLFIGSEKGGESAAIMYSLLLSCKNIGVNPQAWLTDVIRNLPYTKPEDYRSLLPNNWVPKSNPASPYLPEAYKI